MTAPIRPLTPAQLAVAECVAKGRTNKRIGQALRISPRTVQAHIAAIAILLPNPDGLPAKMLVFQWAVRQDWPRRAA